MIRDYQPSDAEQIKELHASSGLDYTLYDLNSPLCFVKKVKEVDGRVVAAMILRLTSETLLVVSGGPAEKMAAMQDLQPEVLADAYGKGLDDVVAVIPKTILGKFAKRLKQLGWNQDRDGWVLFSRSTH